MTQFRKVIILCPHAAVVESAYTADLKSAPKGYGFKSRQRHHVRRTQLRSVSAVCVRAAKTAHPLSPSSFPKRESHGGLPFRFETPALYPLPRSSFQKRSLQGFAFVLREECRGDSRIARAWRAKPFCRSSAHTHNLNVAVGATCGRPRIPV